MTFLHDVTVDRPKKLILRPVMLMEQQPGEYNQKVWKLKGAFGHIYWRYP